MEGAWQYGDRVRWLVYNGLEFDPSVKGRRNIESGYDYNPG